MFHNIILDGIFMFCDTMKEYYRAFILEKDLKEIVTASEFLVE